ncbi:hypothetical protein KI387_016019, partial [Taxus chinensis]
TLPQGKQLHALMLVTAMEQSPILATKLVNLYALWGCFKEAHTNFQCTLKLNSNPYIAMIRGYVKHGFCYEAIEIYHQMQNEGVVPYNFTFPFILKAWIEVSDLKQGIEADNGGINGATKYHAKNIKCLSSSPNKCHNRPPKQVAQNERADKANLREENANLRAENQALKDALERSKSVCQADQLAYKEYMHRLCLENSSLNEGLPVNNISASAPNHIEKPIEPLEPIKFCPGLDAISATQELIRMVDIDKSLWTKSGTKEVLNLERYVSLFAFKHNNTNMKREVTRNTSVVMMNGIELVEAFMDEMFAELQFLSPLVSTREAYFLRYCHRLAERVWAIVDFSAENIHHNVTLHFKRPSGCIIQELPNGYSKVAWVEHSEVEDRAVDGMYEQLVKSGMAFGAQRWVTTLERQCQRL